MTFVNAMYWGLVTGTTVGYGDVSPTTNGNKIFACFFLVFAVIVTANALSTGTCYNKKNLTIIIIKLSLRISIIEHLVVIIVIVSVLEVLFPFFYMSNKTQIVPLTFFLFLNCFFFFFSLYTTSLLFLIFFVLNLFNFTVGDALMSNPGGDQMGAILDKKLDAEFLMSIDMDGSGEVTEYEYLAAMVSFVCLF